MTHPEDSTQARVAAARLARDVLSHLDHGVDDILALADWLLTGAPDVALAMSDQRASHYIALRGSDGPDAVRWVPGLEVASTGP